MDSRCRIPHEVYFIFIPSESFRLTLCFRMIFAFRDGAWYRTFVRKIRAITEDL